MKEIRISVTREEFINGTPFIAPDVSSSRKFIVSSFNDGTKYISYGGVHYCNVGDVSDRAVDVYGLGIFDTMVRAKLIFKNGS